MEKPLMLAVKETYKLWAVFMRSVAAEAGVPDSYRMTLTYLLRHPGASQKELAAHCGVTTASVSQTVKEMGMTGYLKKVPDDKDQRYVKLYLTERGEERAEEIRRRIHAADARLTALLTREREAEIVGMMEELSQIIEKELLGCCAI